MFGFSPSSPSSPSSPLPVSAAATSVAAGNEDNTFFLYFVTFRRPRPYIVKLPEMFQQQLFLFGWASVIEPVECFTRENQSIVVVRFLMCPEANKTVDLFLLRTILQQAADWFRACITYHEQLSSNAEPNVQCMVCTRKSLLHVSSVSSSNDDDAPERNSPLWACDVTPPHDESVVFSWNALSTGTGTEAGHASPPPLTFCLFQSVCTQNTYDVRKRFRDVRRRHVDTIAFKKPTTPVRDTTAHAAPAPAAAATAAVDDLWSFLKTCGITDFFGNYAAAEDIMAGVPDIPCDSGNSSAARLSDTSAEDAYMLGCSAFTSTI